MIPVKSLVARGLIAFSPGIFIFFGVKNMCDSFILAVQQVLRLGGNGCDYVWAVLPVSYLLYG